MDNKNTDDITTTNINKLCEIIKNKSVNYITLIDNVDINCFNTTLKKELYKNLLNKCLDTGFKAVNTKFNCYRKDCLLFENNNVFSIDEKYIDVVNLKNYKMILSNKTITKYNNECFPGLLNYDQEDLIEDNYFNFNGNKIHFKKINNIRNECCISINNTKNINKILNLLN